MIHLAQPDLFKAPRYPLTLNGFTSPAFMNRRGTPALLTINDPRTVTDFQMTFTVPEEGADLPVGEVAELRLDRDFYLVLQRDITREETELGSYRSALKQHYANLTQSEYDQVWRSVLNVIDNQPTAPQLTEMLERTQEAFRHAQAKVNTARYGTPLEQFKAEECLARARGRASATDTMIVTLVKRLNTQGYQLHSEYAYSPKEGCGRRAYSPGADHLVTALPLSRGRWVRANHDALCKPRGKFQALSPLHDEPLITCSRCLQHLFSLYITENTITS